MKMKPLPSQAELKRLFDYDATTGNLIWKLKTGTAKVGDIAGSLNKRGYRAIKVYGILYQAHRLIWCWHYGIILDGLIVDHFAGGNPQDNRIDNLQTITQQKNMHKSKRQKNNTSGFTGVYWNNFKNKWQAGINFDNKSVYIGRYDNINDAAKAYDEFAFDLFGHRFAQTNFPIENYIPHYMREAA